MNGRSGAEEKSSSYSSANAHELEMPAFKGSRGLRLRWDCFENQCFLSSRYYLNFTAIGLSVVSKAVVLLHFLLLLYLALSAPRNLFVLARVDSNSGKAGRFESQLPESLSQP